MVLGKGYVAKGGMRAGFPETSKGPGMLRWGRLILSVFRLGAKKTTAGQGRPMPTRIDGWAGRIRVTEVRGPGLPSPRISIASGESVLPVNRKGAAGREERIRRPPTPH